MKTSSRLAVVAKACPCSATVKPIQLFTVNEALGALAEAQKVHCHDGAQFDKSYTVQ